MTVIVHLRRCVASGRGRRECTRSEVHTACFFQFVCVTCDVACAACGHAGAHEFQFEPLLWSDLQNRKTKTARLTRTHALSLFYLRFKNFCRFPCDSPPPLRERSSQ